MQAEYRRREENELEDKERKEKSPQRYHTMVAFRFTSTNSTKNAMLTLTRGMNNSRTIKQRLTLQEICD